MCRIHNNRITNDRSLFNHDIGTNDGIVYFSIHFTTIPHDCLVNYSGIRNVLWTKPLVFCINFPKFFIQIKYRNQIDQFHIGLPIRPQCSYIFPIAIKLVCKDTVTSFMAIWYDMFTKVTSRLITQCDQCLA